MTYSVFLFFTDPCEFSFHALTSAGATVDGEGPAPQRQHGRHRGPPEEAAPGPGGHRPPPPALVLLREAADGQDAAPGHQDPEGLCDPGHHQPTGPAESQAPLPASE